MPVPNVALLRRAYAAYARGDTAAMLDLVDPAWSGPTSIPAPPTRARRSATAAASCKPHSRSRPSAACVPSWRRVIGQGDKVVVAVRTPGADAYRVRPSDDRDYALFTVRDGRIVAPRDCRDRADALRLAGIEEHP